MHTEKITVSNTESGQSMEVVVLKKQANLISIVIGEGVHSVQCDLTPTKYGNSYAGSVMGREMIYMHSVKDVQAELNHDNPALKKSRSFKK
ncbi:MAG TPA: hypothetical protein EYQ42_05775 [Thiotrichaceae bacterium]|jgi:hypothetical protein|nr:hypothetical protein [Thiotrichaceae bacterium]HIM07509.1 hypothetical protein [Gammaproteobacteria bacterium]